jgi:hypothetical protein
VPALRAETDFEEDNAGGSLREHVGKWPVFTPGQTGLETNRDVLTNRFLREVYVGLFRAKESWEIPALLLWSAVNYDMGPDIHVAMHRRWQSLYGAELISATGAVIQCTVSKPPTTKEAAMKLAWEQYHYCPDIVWQGVGTISDLAATLLNHDIWYFWWD